MILIIIDRRNVEIFEQIKRVGVPLFKNHENIINENNF
jgi:hypothetical protein